MADITRRDYTGRSFARFQTKLEEYLQASFPEATNDLYEDHILKVLTELISYAGDQLAFYLDMAYNECLWDRVGHRRNIVALAKLLGYTPRGISSAQVTLDCETDPFVGTLSLSRGTKIATQQSGITFEVAQNYAINAPDTTFQITAIEGASRSDTFFSNAQTGQQYTSIYDKVSSSVIPTVTVDGVAWTRVPFLWDVLAGNYYELAYVDDEKIRVTFGDGVHGNVPPDTVPIVISYLTSNGSAGNLATGRINTTISGTVLGVPQDIRVVSNENSSGGAPEETVEEIRNNAPIYFQSLGVVTTGKDLRGFIEAAAGIIKSQVIVDPSTKIVLAYVVASGYLAPSGALLTSLQADIEEVLVMGAILGLRPATFPTVDSTARIYILPNYSVEEVTDSTNAAVEEYFTPADPAQSDKTIGTPVYKSDWVRLLDEIEGVDHVELDKLTRTPSPVYVQWATGGAVFSSLEVGTNSVEETWTVTLTSPTTFEVFGSVSGLQTATGTLDTPYSTDPDVLGVSRLSFLLPTGVNPNSASDYATIKTSRYVESVPVDDGEFVLPGTMSFTYHYV